ncbi:hypothetical protein, partial [Pseudomonas sp. GM33]|uniref:hypothetical protein n=1 Tax=Pseudomonas sp. GM33 TaxID=1144329 RepID=UPI001EE65306
MNKKIAQWGKYAIGSVLQRFRNDPIGQFFVLINIDTSRSNNRRRLYTSVGKVVACATSSPS